MSSYDYFTHRHRFAAWAAARAAQRGLGGGSVACLISALEEADAPGVVLSILPTLASSDEFDGLHRKTCRQILLALTGKCESVSYGRAAKLLAIYLKSMVIVGPQITLPIASHIHPPIDDVLLKNINRDKTLPKQLRKQCGGVRWTQLDEQAYFDLIGQLRKHQMDLPAFWMLERYWQLNAEPTFDN
jgi:hypothetical protein